MSDKDEKEEGVTSSVTPSSEAPKYRVVLKVLKPRWCNQTKRRLNPGQTITLESNSLKDFRLMVMRHKAKTVPIEGEIPNFKAAARMAKKKGEWTSGQWEGEAYSSFREFSAEKTDEEAEEEEALSGDLVCSECGKGPFKNAAGLKSHMTRAHG